MNVRFRGLVAAIALCCAAGALPAQTSTDVLRHVPKDCCLVVRTSGLAGWRDAFAKTQVAKLCQGPTLGPLLRQLEQVIDSGIESAPADLPADLAKLRAAATDYSGSAVFALRIDMASLGEAIANKSAPKMTVAMLFGGDGHTDLAELAEMARKNAEEDAGTKLRDLVVGDHRLRVESSGPFSVSLPTMIGDHLVMLVGNDLDADASAFLDGEGGVEFETTSGQTMAVHADLRGAMHALQAFVIERAQAADAPVDVDALIRLAGFWSIDGIDVAVGAEGLHAACDATLHFNDQPRGVWGMYGTGGHGALHLLNYVPTESDSWSVTEFHFGAVYDTLAAMWEEAGDAVPMSREAAEQAFAKAMKVRLKEDLIDHLGSEMMTAQENLGAGDASDDEDDADGMGSGMSAAMKPLSGTCFCVGLRDGKAFAASLETLLRGRGLHAARKTEDYQGEKVYDLRIGGVVEVEYVVADDLLLVTIGGGDKGKRALRAVLDERAARRSGKQAGELPKAVQERLAAVPAGWNNISILHLEAQLQTFATIFANGFNESAGGAVELRPEAIASTIERLLPELRQLGLDRIAGVGYMTADRWVVRLRW